MWFTGVYLGVTVWSAWGHDAWSASDLLDVPVCGAPGRRSAVP